MQNLLDAAEEVQGPLLDCHRTCNLIVDIDEGRIHELRFFRSRRLAFHRAFLRPSKNLSSLEDRLQGLQW